MAKLKNGSYVYTVCELLEELSQFKPEQKIFVIGHDSNNKFYKKPFYKIEEAADETEIYLYC